MKNEQEKLVSFKLRDADDVSITHGYNIVNSFPVHFHSSYTIGIVESGERCFNYRNENIIQKKNDIFVIQPFEPHSCTSVNEMPHSYKVISFNFNSRNLLPYFNKMIYNDEHLLNKLRKFHSIAKYENNNDKSRLLFSEINEGILAFSDVELMPYSDKEIKSGIKTAKIHIENNCMEQILLNEVAGKANMSLAHFNREFHRLIGMSPYAYLLFCRVKKSTKILLKGGTVTLAAYESGFFDQSHFIRLFKKHIGVTPGNFLKNNSVRK